MLVRRRSSSMNSGSPSTHNILPSGCAKLKHFCVVLTFFISAFALYFTIGQLGKHSGLRRTIYQSLNYTPSVANNGTENRPKHIRSTELAFFLEPYEFQYSISAYTSFTNEFSLVFGPNAHSAEKNIDESTVGEALNTLGAAAQSRIKGDSRKAQKLYDHALALQPKHPQVLVEYGLFVENIKSDVLTASTLYTKALILWPEDSYAKKHFARTLPVVEEIDGQMLRSLDMKRERFIHIPRGSQSLRRLMRESYVEYIYHTVALEGNTMSLLQTRSILETHMAVSGKSVMEHNEILGLDAALRYLNRSLINRDEPLSVQDILELHRRVFGYVDPVEAGHFRRTQVYVGGFVPCMPDQIDQEMTEFIDWLKLDSTQNVHPVELAALVHYKFVIVHPFVDGNGRTARILMNLILMRAGFPPVIIKLEERLRYYETLKLANDGDLRPFIRFVASCTDRTLETYLRFTTEISPTSSDSPGGNIIGNESEIIEHNVPRS